MDAALFGGDSPSMPSRVTGRYLCSGERFAKDEAVGGLPAWETDVTRSDGISEMCSSLLSMRSNEAYMREKGSSFLVGCQTLSRCEMYNRTSAPSVHCIDIRYQVGRTAHRPDAPRHNELF